jgi:hypothetical protein
VGKDVDDILIGANGTFWTAPKGTAAPADESAAPGAGWIDLGHLSEDGVTITDSRDMSVVHVWDLLNPARRHVTGADFVVEAILRQWDKNTVVRAFRGATLTTVTAGHFKLEPPEPEDVDDNAYMVDWRDGTRKYRLFILSMSVTDDMKTTVNRADPADLPLTLGINGVDGVKPWYLLSNDPALNPA